MVKDAHRISREIDKISCDIKFCPPVFNIEHRRFSLMDRGTIHGRIQDCGRVDCDKRTSVSAEKVSPVIQATFLHCFDRRMASTSQRRPSDIRGSSGNTIATSSSGDFFGLLGANIFLSSSYTFGSALNGSMTFAGATLSSLGLNLGDTTCSVVTGDNIIVRAVSPVPIPAAFPLLASGLGGLGLLGWRGKRKTAAAIVA